MSTTTISLTIEANGVPTNVTSVVLSDAANTFGVRRTDTGETIIAAGTAIPPQSTGVYQFTFTDPAPGLEYEVWIVWVYGGATYREQRFLPGSDPATSAEALTENISAFLGEAKTFTFVALDAAGQPADLSGKVLTFSVAPDHNLTPPTFTRDTSGNGVTVGGTDHNEITIALTPTNTAAPATLHYTLWNSTDNLVLRNGKLTIKPAAQQS